MAILTLQLTTPPALPVSEQISAPGQGGVSQGLDCVLLPWVSAQAIKDAVNSIANYAQAGFMLVAVDGQLGALAPIATVTYTASSGAQTITINGVSAGGGFTAGATDALTAIAAVNAINGTLALQLIATASVDPTNATRVLIQGRWPGTGLNAITTAVTGTGAAVSAATLGGSGAAPARAGTNLSQVNQLGIGTPNFP
jgi:hypothetical protein